jgi:hypothetical protein
MEIARAQPHDRLAMLRGCVAHVQIKVVAGITLGDQDHPPITRLFGDDRSSCDGSASRVSLDQLLGFPPGKIDLKAISEMNCIRSASPSGSISQSCLVADMKTIPVNYLSRLDRHRHDCGSLLNGLKQCCPSLTLALLGIVEVLEPSKVCNRKL